MKRAAVAVSGGVDSLCALVLLKEAGHDVLALHGLFTSKGTDGHDPLPGLERACKTLNVPLHVIDLRNVFFREVIVPFGQNYADGRTPNPCSLCNRRVKFGALLDAALSLGAEKLVTGHYARLSPTPFSDSPALYAAKNKDRDQSYFLSLVPTERLRHAHFPLAERTKAWCAAQVESAGLVVPLPSSSQDICFVEEKGPDAHCAYLLAHWASLGILPPGAGPVLLADSTGKIREVGVHQGLWRYTEGQRRGIGIAHHEPLYVLSKNVERNALIVGGKALLGMTGCLTGKANFLCEPKSWPKRVFARLRYRRRAAPALVSIRNGCLDIRLESGEFPAAPGQLAVIYDAEERVLAGGIIEHTTLDEALPADIRPAC
ncbi:MAG: tRNA-specific 2-thiouridylase [Desulfovibrio sp.]|jgi:tRNA-specific 2-thiouridylase|nr:tRNA-specific 2-thiouridylase [Desulfovibrio sp.]